MITNDVPAVTVPRDSVPITALPPPQFVSLYPHVEPAAQAAAVLTVTVPATRVAVPAFLGKQPVLVSSPPVVVQRPFVDDPRLVSVSDVPLTPPATATENAPELPLFEIAKVTGGLAPVPSVDVIEVTLGCVDEFQ